MDFNQLLSKMQELDSTPATEAVTDECGMAEMPGMPTPAMPTPTMPEPVKDKARMNINISAEGDAIDDVLKLMTKVNPDMINQKDTPLTPPPGIADLSPTMDMPMDMPKPINKIIPDFDADNDDMPGGENDIIDIKAIGDKGDDNDYDNDGKLDRHEKDHDEEEKLHKSIDRDDDGDHDMDDHKKEEFANKPDEDYEDINYLVNKLAGGMNRPKGTHPKVAGGDNPMQAMEDEGSDLKSVLKRFEDKMGEEFRYFGMPDVNKIGMLIKAGNMEDAAEELAGAFSDQDGGSEKFDSVYDRALDELEDAFGGTKESTYESLRAEIRAELLQRLAEAKGE